MLQRDLDDLDTFDVPPAPVHLSNSTDAFQDLEQHAGHTAVVLAGLQKYRHRFTTVTVLTKNAPLASQKRYIDLLQSFVDLPADHPCASQFQKSQCPALRMEVSLAYWRDDMRHVFDPRCTQCRGPPGRHSEAAKVGHSRGPAD